MRSSIYINLDSSFSYPHVLRPTKLVLTIFCAAAAADVVVLFAYDRRCVLSLHRQIFNEHSAESNVDVRCRYRRRTMDVCLYSTVKTLTNLDRLEYRVRVRVYAVRLHPTTSIEQRSIDGCYDDDRVQCSTHYYEKKITFDDLYFFTSTKPNIPPPLSPSLSLCRLLGNGHSVLATNAGVYSCTPNTTKQKNRRPHEKPSIYKFSRAQTLVSEWDRDSMVAWMWMWGVYRLYSVHRIA